MTSARFGDGARLGRQRSRILDTSVFIASESGRPLDEDRLPAESAISVVTLAELHAGVLAAQDTETRAIAVLPVDERSALAWARLRVHLVETGRRVNGNDLWVAACAVAHRLPPSCGCSRRSRGRPLRSPSLPVHTVAVAAH